MDPAHRIPTLADLEALPVDVKGEIIEGVMYTMTRPRGRHQRTALAVGADLRDPFDRGRGGPGGWWIVPEPGIELPNTPEIAPDPHNGVPATFTSLLRGDINFMVAASNAVMPFVDAKTVKPLAVTSAARSPQLPDVPTMEEQGFKNFQMYGWAMLFAPSNTPQPIVEKLHDEIAKALTDPAVHKLLTDQGAKLPPLSLAQLRDYVHRERELYGAIVRAGDMKAE